MLSPKRTKFRKMQKGRMKGLSQRGHVLSNGMFGIKSLDACFLTSRQIEAARIAATRYMKREGQLWIKIFPDKPITKKPLEVRMGKGKGGISSLSIKPNTLNIINEIWNFRLRGLFKNKTLEMEKRNLRKERIGIVTSNKMEKSIVVSEVNKVKHPMYGKFVLKTKKYIAHDQENECNIGDTVKIMETRPLSKSKCWRLVQILERAK